MLRASDTHQGVAASQRAYLTEFLQNISGDNYPGSELSQALPGVRRGCQDELWVARLDDFDSFLPYVRFDAGIGML